MVDRRMDAAKERAAIGRQTTDELFNDTYAKAGIQPTNVVVDRRSPRPSERAGTPDPEAERALQEMIAYERSREAQQIGQRAAARAAQVASTKESEEAGAATKLISRSLFFWMMGWHWRQWTTLQLSIGLLSVMFFGLAYSLESTWMGRRISEVGSAVNAVTSFVGFDFSRFSPENMFWVLYLFLLGILWLSLFATVVVYMCMQNKALSGKGAGLKLGMVALAMIGYAVPVANLFPWVFFYILVMARYPK